MQAEIECIYQVSDIRLLDSLEDEFVRNNNLFVKFTFYSSFASSITISKFTREENIMETRN